MFVVGIREDTMVGWVVVAGDSYSHDDGVEFRAVTVTADVVGLVGGMTRCHELHVPVP